MQVEVVAGFADLTLDPTNLALEATMQDILTGVTATNTKLDTLQAAIGDAADAAGDPTVIGLLKQIAENTTPDP